jgi:hypothetical protein
MVPTACNGQQRSRLHRTISYPLYLWHWPALSFAAILHAGTPPTTVRGIAVALSFALAWLTFIFFERPIRAQRSGRVSVALVSGLAILGAAGLGMYVLRGFPQRFNVDVQALSPEPRWNDFCPEEFRTQRVFNYCKGTQAEPPEVLFLGDSRAQSVYDGVADVLGAGHAVSLLARGGCPPTGTTTVALTVTDTHGQTGSTTVTLQVVQATTPPPPPPEPPTGSASERGRSGGGSIDVLSLFAFAIVLIVAIALRPTLRCRSTNWNT